ncbi:MAG: hypothetical protein AAGJ12_10435 [Bacteroidota bacterium]
MDDNKKIAQFVDELIDSASSLDRVNTPPFFKEKVLKRLTVAHTSEEVPVFFTWFTPKVQFAAFLVFVILNLGTLYFRDAFNETEELQAFAENYGLTSSQEESLFN